MIKDFDPRLKMILALIIPYCSFNLSSILGLGLNYLFIVVLFFSVGAYRSGLKIFKYALILFVLNYLMLKNLDLTEVFKFFSIGLIFIIKFSPIGIMIRFVSVKMKTGHFVASMQTLHLPKHIIIIIAVILRFFPTLKIELKNIQNAMKLRGIGFNFKNLLTKPIRTFEFSAVPLVMRSMTLSDGLSAAAMSRGLDLERKNSSYVSLRLDAYQIIFTVFMITICILNIYFDASLYPTWSLL